MALLLSILCSTTIALLFKRLEARGGNRYAATTANYAVAVACGGVMAMLAPVPFPLGEVTATHWLEALERRGDLSGPAILAWAMIVGPLAGVLYCVSFLVYSASIGRNGVGISAAMARLGVVVPLVVAVLAWGERPSTMQAVGIATAMAAIVAIGLGAASPGKGDGRWLLLVLLLVSGLADFSNKTFQRHAPEAYRPFYLMFVFGTALLASIPFVVRRAAGAGWRDGGMGALIGVPNFFASFFLLRALGEMDASLAFPLNSAGAIVAVNVGGVLLFGEELTRRKLLALGLVLVAVVLINVPG